MRQAALYLHGKAVVVAVAAVIHLNDARVSRINLIRHQINRRRVRSDNRVGGIQDVVSDIVSRISEIQVAHAQHLRRAAP